MVQQIQWETVSDLFFNLFSKSELVPSVYLGHFFCLGVSYLKEWSLRCSPGRGNADRCAVMLYVGEGLKGAMVLAPLSSGFQALPLLPRVKLGPSGAGSRVGGLVQALGPCGSLQRPLREAGSFSCCRPNPHGCFESEV